MEAPLWPTAAAPFPRARVPQPALPSTAWLTTDLASPPARPPAHSLARPPCSVLSLSAPTGQSSLVFASVFFIVWAGAAVVTLNAKLLGGNM